MRVGVWKPLILSFRHKILIHPAVIQKEDVVISVATDASLTDRDPDKDPNFEKFRRGILSPKPKNHMVGAQRQMCRLTRLNGI